jgi:Recombinase
MATAASQSWCGSSPRTSSRYRHGTGRGRGAPPHLYRNKEALAQARRAARSSAVTVATGHPQVQGASAAAAVKRQADARDADVMPAIKTLQDNGTTSLRTIARGLNAQGIPTSRGKQWTAVQAANVLARDVA